MIEPSCHLLLRGGGGGGRGALLESGGRHINFGDKRGEHKKLFLITGGNRRFVEKISNFCPLRVLKSVENSSSWTSGLSWKVFSPLHGGELSYQYFLRFFLIFSGSFLAVSWS